MKKLLTMFGIALLCCAIVFPAWVSAETLGDYEYTDNGDGTCTIIGYSGLGGEITIPSELDGLSVTIIGENAFSNAGLTHVSIPASVVKIDNNAFYSNQLTGVTFAEGIATIGKEAFAYNKLASIQLPNSVTTIEKRAFSDNTLSEFALPSGSGTWYRSDGTSVNGGDNVDPNYGYSKETFLYEDNGDGTCTIIEYYGAGGDVIIPETLGGLAVKALCHESFSYKNITSIVIPPSVTELGNYVFSGNSLTSVTIPSSITEISSGAFHDNKLTSVTMLGDVTTIGWGAFGMNKFTSFAIPSTVTKIQGDAFMDNLLTSIAVPSSVTEIGRNAFKNNSLTSVTIPSSVTSIGSAAFNNNQISMVNSQASTGIIYARDALGTDDTSTIVSYGGAADIIAPGMIPNDVRTIGDYAFANCELTSVTIPDGVTKIEEYAFNQNAITTLDFIGLSLLVIEEGAFSTNSLSAPLNLPDSLTDIGSAFADNNLFANEFVLPGPNLTMWHGSDDNTYYSGNRVNVYYSYSRKTYEYTDNGDGTCNIERYNGASGDIAIPATIDGLDVVCIKNSAFENKGLTTVTIPAGLKCIEGNAFADNLLTSVTFLGNNVTEIGNGAFVNNLLASFDIPRGVTEIKSYTFDNNKLQSIVIPNGVTKIEYAAFRKNLLTNVTIPNSIIEIIGGAFNDNKIDTINGQVSNGIIYKRNADGSIDTSTIVSYGGAQKDLGAGFIPDTVTTISHGGFEEAALTSIVVPDSIKRIRRNALGGNTFTDFMLPAGTGTWVDGDNNTHSGGDFVAADGEYTKANQKPNRKSACPAAVSETTDLNTAYTLELVDVFEDADNDAMTYEVDIDSAGYVSADASYSYPADTGGEYELKFRAHDGMSYSEDTYTVTLTVQAPPNRKEGVPETKDELVEVNEIYRIDLATIFEDVNSDPVTYEMKVDDGSYGAVVQNYSYSSATAKQVVMKFRAHDGNAYSQDTYVVNLTVANGVYNITYSTTEGSGSAVNSHTGDSYAKLHDGSGFERSGWLIDGWLIGSANYMLGDLYLMPNAEVAAEAFWIQDTDNDGVSDAEEAASGSNPNDAGDAPKKGDAQITIYDNAGNPLAGVTCVINSAPVEVVTNANGVAVFRNIYLTEHTLSVRNGSGPVSSYTMVFRNTGTNNVNVADDGDGDNEGAIDTTYGNTFVSLNVRIRQNSGGFWVVSNTSMSTLADKAVNPRTGDTSSAWWMYAVAAAALICSLGYIVRRKVLLNR